MAHNEARRRRERKPPGGSEGYLPQRRQFIPGIETARHRLDDVNFQPSWGPGPPRGGDYYSRREYDDEVDPASRPYAPVIRRRVDSRSGPIPQYQRQRSLGRESSGHGLAAERVIIAETPGPLPYESSSEDDDRQRFEPRRGYQDQLHSQVSDRDDARIPNVAREEVIIERQDETRPFEPVNSAVYEDPDGERYHIYRPVSPVLEDLDTFDDFQFAFQAEEPSKDAELSDLETPTTESESTQKAERPLSNILTAPGIYSSTYSGTAELGAQHDVNLTIHYDPRGQKQPLFRWL
ncbi:hypothetical protein ACHAQJ_001804 [Trichoderma viride]